jgi:hypothetical protein
MTGSIVERLAPSNGMQKSIIIFSFGPILSCGLWIVGSIVEMPFLADQFF